MKLILKDKTELELKTAQSINEMELKMTLKELTDMIPKITAENISRVEFWEDDQKIGESNKLKLKANSVSFSPAGEIYNVSLSFDLKTEEDLRFESLEDTVDKLVEQSLTGGGI